MKSGTVTFSDSSALFERKQYYEEHQHLRRSSCHLKGSYKIIELAKDYIANHNIGDKVNLGAAFCLGRCTDGVTIKIDDEIICGVNENNFQQIFDEKVLVCLD